MTDKMLYFRALNRLRESGRINMWGAAQPLAAMFDLPEKTARNILIEWMDWVSEKPENRDK